MTRADAVSRPALFAVCIVSLVVAAGTAPGKLAAQGLQSRASAGTAGTAPNGTSAEAASSAHSAPFEVGFASWYGSRFQGRTTANGETYDQNKLTAAHRTLPFGTRVRVTNLTNGKSVVVTINDRGPFVAGRIIDLSRAAAQAIGVTVAGVAMVRLDIIGRTVPPAAHGSTASKPVSSVIIQVGAFRNLDNAVRLNDRLRSRGFDPIYERDGKITRVILVSIHESELPAVRRRLSQLGIDSILVRHR